MFIKVFIVMDIKIPHHKLFPIIQNLINNGLESLRQEADEEWGLGEMDEIHELQSVNKLVLDKLEVVDGKTLAYVDVYSNNRREDFDVILGGVEYKLHDWFPNLELIENEIVKDWSTGFGTEW